MEVIIIITITITICRNSKVWTRGHIHQHILCQVFRQQNSVVTLHSALQTLESRCYHYQYSPTLKRLHQLVPLLLVYLTLQAQAAETVVEALFKWGLQHQQRQQHFHQETAVYIITYRLQTTLSKTITLITLLFFTPCNNNNNNNPTNNNNNCRHCRALSI